MVRGTYFYPWGKDALQALHTIYAPCQRTNLKYIYSIFKNLELVTVQFKHGGQMSAMCCMSRNDFLFELCRLSAKVAV